MSLSNLENTKSIVMLSNSVVQDDPRIRKWAQTLNNSGWVVTTVGRAPKKRSCSLTWSHINVYSHVEKSKNKHKKSIFKKLIYRFGKNGGLIRRAFYYFGLRFGLTYFPKSFLWCLKESDSFYNKIQTLADDNIEKADVWVANDWDMLQTISYLRDKKGGKMLYDSHEFATEQFLYSDKWRRWRRPLVKAVEQFYIPRADLVTTVSEGLCSALNNLYSLVEFPTCIRNIPEYEEIKPSQGNTPRVILYQGVIMAGRGLEAVIDSVAFWNFDGKLIIRGPYHDNTYYESLKLRAKNINFSRNIFFDGPVEPAKMIEVAKNADIGVMFLDSLSTHNKHALPNKVFEYIMAGLCVCVSDLPDMKKIIDNYQVGLCVGSLSPSRIAQRLNELNKDNNGEEVNF